MDWEFFAPMVVAVTAILTVGGVAVLRPIAKRLADLVELFGQDRHAGIQGDQVRDLLETMNARLELMEDRLDFTERLLHDGRAKATEDDAGEGAD